MASSPLEFAARLLNRRPENPTTSSSYKNIKGYLHSDNSWLPSPEPANSKPQNNVDLSWLPNYNDKTFTNDSDYPNHQHVQSNSDDSWLPSYNDTRTKATPPAPKSSNSNRSRKTDKDADDSWLPSIPFAKNNNINQDNNSQIQNNSSTTTTSTKSTANPFRRVETSPDRSWLPSPPVVNNGDKKREIINNHNTKPSNQQTQNIKVLNKKPESTRSHGLVSPSISESSVETDSLGGVSTLLRRWKDVEVKDSNRKPKSLRVVDGSGRCALPNTTDESVVGENKCFSSVIGKTRLIRGRQAFIDFLNMVEQDKRRELESLAQRKPVSKFPNRGRIQALLRVRCIRIGGENQKEVKSHKFGVSKTMKSLWDKISAGVKQDTSASRKVNNNGEGIKKTNTTPECSVDCSPAQELTILTAASTPANSQEPVSTTASHQSAQEDTHSEILVPDTTDYQEKSQSQCPSAKTYSSGIDGKALENFHHWINEYSQTQSDWDDEEEQEEYYNYNWISDIARPRSDWECMRHKRYQEMLHLHSYNQDIQQLLERKSVSGFLSSDQRNALDQLMVSRAQGVSRTVSRKEDKNGEDKFIGQTACSSPPTQSPALEQRSWKNHHRHHRPNHYLQNNSNTPQSSFMNHSSIELELIYDLRGYVEQIHQEIMELRKVVTSCINMQVKNQHQSIQKKRSEQVMTRNCCVCYALQADSFLYRCGHMCTCYDCGLELQCTSGKCPICDDLILDVVRGYAYDD